MKNKYKPNKNVVSSLFKVIREILKISRNVPESIKENIPEIEFKKEFLTVKIQIPRGLGNTTIAKMLMKESKSSAYITGPYWKNMDTEFRGRCFSVRNYWNNLRGRKVDVLIIDCASCISNQDIEDVYRVTANNYVFLG